MRNTVIKAGVYKAGSHLRIIGEIDLIEQEARTVKEAIYIYEVTMLRDPREEFTEAELKTYTDSIKQAMYDQKYTISVVSREEADNIISVLSKNWEVVKPFEEI